MPEETLTVTIKLKDFATRGMRKFHGTVTRVAAKVRAKLMAVKSAVFSLRSAFLALGAGIVLKGFLDAGIAMEKFRVQIKAVLDGNAELARQTMTWVRDFARVTAFTTQDVIQSYVSLRAAGVKVTKDMLNTIGNVSFAFDRTMSDVAIGLVSMEKEVFKRLGVGWTIVGDQATLTLDGMEIKTKKTIGAMRDAVLELFAKKFPDTMKEAEKTISGQLAIMKSQWFEFQAEAVEKGPFQALKALLGGVQEELGETGDASTLVGEIITEAMIAVVRVVGWVVKGIDGIRAVFLIVKKIGAEVMAWLGRSMAQFLEEFTNIVEQVSGNWLVEKIFGEETSHQLAINVNNAAMAVDKFAVDMEETADRVGKAYEDLIDPDEAKLGEKIDKLADRMRGAFNRLKAKMKQDAAQVDISGVLLGPLLEQLEKGEFGKVSAQVEEQTQNRLELATVQAQLIKDAEKAQLGLKLKEAEGRFHSIKTAAMEIGNVFEDNILRALDAAVEGTFRWQKALQQTAKDIGMMFAKKAVGALLEVGATAIAGAAAAKGGVFPAFSKRIPIKSYARGGITQGPELALIGEGKKQEAVVPLDNGQKIPVEMKGGGEATPIVIYAMDGADVMRVLTNNPEAVAAGVNRARRNNPGFLGD